MYIARVFKDTISGAEGKEFIPLLEPNGQFEKIKCTYFNFNSNLKLHNMYKV